MNPAVQIRRLVVEYPSGQGAVRPIDDLSLAIPQGTMTGIYGPSGSGKTSLLSVLAGMIEPTAGQVQVGGVWVNGADLTEYRRKVIGIVFQRYNLLPALTARENVAAPLLVAKVPARVAMRKADKLLGDFGLIERRGFRPAQLSGGEQQRVAIARALVGEPQVVLADEPTANLDRESADVVISVLAGLVDGGRTVVVATHDQRLIPVFDRVIELGGGTSPVVDVRDPRLGGVDASLAAPPR